MDSIRRAGHKETAGALGRILVNEAALTVTTVQQDGKPKRSVSRSAATEALRAEIAKDAKALLGLKDAHKALAKRKVTLDRLQALRDSAEKIAGKRWAAAYRVLATVGQADERVAQLLKEASRPRGRAKAKKDEPTG
jgi:hypothetical protein